MTRVLSSRRFDNGFFSPAIGNLPNPAYSFLTRPTTRPSMVSHPRIPRSSLLIKPIKPMNACPYVMSPTLNSFAAYSAGSATTPGDLVPLQGGYTYSPSEGLYFDPFGNTVTMYDIPATDEPVASSASTTQPAAIKGNSILDAISGTIKTLAPVAGAAIAPKAASITGKQTATQKQMMQQFLQGKLPGYEINPQTGQLQPKSSANTLILVGIGAAVLIAVVAMR